jgi:hypothetical protein
VISPKTKKIREAGNGNVTMASDIYCLRFTTLLAIDLENTFPVCLPRKTGPLNNHGPWQPHRTVKDIRIQTHREHGIRRLLHAAKQNHHSQ